MRTISTFFFALSCLFSSSIFAQSGAEIKGRIESGSPAEPVFSATILLVQLPDSQVASGGLSEEAGTFRLQNLKAGRYLLKIRRIDLGEQTLPDLNLAENQVLDLGTLKMEAQARNLKEVQVLGKKPVFERTEDRMVFHVDQLISATGSNALEMLRKSPGVVVDKDQQIMLNGRTGPRIYINGKPSYLSVADLAAFLSSLPASDLESIEIIENPSARFDASGKAGIINLILKRDKTLGTNGSSNFTYTQGQYFPKFETGSRFNHRTKHFTVFAGYTNNTYRNWSYNNFYRTQNELGYDQRSEEDSRRQGQYYRAGMDWLPDSRQILGVLVWGGYTENRTTNTSRTRILNAGNQDWTESLWSDNKGLSFRNNLNANLNYQWKDTSGRQFNADLDYGRFSNNSRLYQPNRYLQPNGEFVRESNFANHAPSLVEVKTFKADWEQRFSFGKINLGGKIAMVETDNDFSFFNVNQGIYAKDSGRSNHFIYLENVNALYGTWARKWSSKWNTQFGIRMEQTNSKGDLKGNAGQGDEVVERSYLDFFPSLTLNFQPSKSQSYSFQYSRRIDRPGYQDLNPFEYKLDELTYSKGNPFLRPQYTHSFSLGLTLFQFLNQNISYSTTQGFFGQITDTIERTKAFITTRNIANEQVLAYNLSSPIPIRSWWNGFLNVGVQRLSYQADFGEGKEISFNTYTWNAYMQHSFTLMKDLSAEVAGGYNAPGVWGGTFRSRATGNLDLAIKWKTMAQKMTLTLAFNDVFWTQQWGGINQFGGIRVEARGGWESRQLRFSMLYTFGNQQVAGARNRKTGALQEAGRVK